MPKEEDMKIQSKFKVTYSEDVDILMIQLSNKKVDDSYDTDRMIVQVDESGEPVILEVFKGSQFLKDLNKALPGKLKKELVSKASASIAHRIK